VLFSLSSSSLSTSPEKGQTEGMEMRIDIELKDDKNNAIGQFMKLEKKTKLRECWER
jgi:hypothetical protein